LSVTVQHFNSVLLLEAVKAPYENPDKKPFHLLFFVIVLNALDPFTEG